MVWKAAHVSFRLRRKRSAVFYYNISIACVPLLSLPHGERTIRPHPQRQKCAVHNSISYSIFTAMPHAAVSPTVRDSLEWSAGSGDGIEEHEMDRKHERTRRRSSPMRNTDGRRRRGFFTSGRARITRARHARLQSTASSSRELIDADTRESSL